MKENIPSYVILILCPLFILKTKAAVYMLQNLRDFDLSNKSNK